MINHYNKLPVYYNRTISPETSKLIEPDGALSWLCKFVKNHKELDFLIGRNNAIEWISVYRGLARIFTIRPTKDPDIIEIIANDRYRKMSDFLYGTRSVYENFEKDIGRLIDKIEHDYKFDRYYKNIKEGFFQNELSRRYGICSTTYEDFVIIDKEAVIGYSNQNEKDMIFGEIQKQYKQLQKEISILNPGRYGRNLEKKAIGNELDFLALDKLGNVLLIEYKHGTNTSGIYLSPMQIGLYYDIFTTYPLKELQHAVFDMLNQKQKIGLINPDWSKPEGIREIIPVLIISEFNYRSSAKEKLNEILGITRNKFGSGFLKNLQIFNYTLQNGLTPL